MPRGLDLAQTPFAVVDVETTGFTPRLHDRIVEIAILRLRPDGTEEDAYATLVNPGRDVGPTGIHGIGPDEILDAPAFREIVGDVAERLADAVLVAHNAPFDRDFLTAEFRWAGARFPRTPTICTLHLSWVLYPNLGRHGLGACCAHTGIDVSRHHIALDDARATSRLLVAYLAEARTQGRVDARALGCTPQSFARVIWPRLNGSGRTAPRRTTAAGLTSRHRVALDPSGHAPVRSSGIAAYLDLLELVLEDRVITEQEAGALLHTAIDWGLTPEDLVDAHRAYLAGLVRFDLEDDTISDTEMRDIRVVSRLLSIDDRTLDMALFAAMTGADEDASLRQPVSVPSLAGLSVHFSGELRGFLDGHAITIERADRLAVDAGLHVAHTITPTLDVLVVADPSEPSLDLDSARELGIRVVVEEAFWRDIGFQVQ
jgi:DNA polymerase III subunit epsilon